MSCYQFIFYSPGSQLFSVLWGEWEEVITAVSHTEGNPLHSRPHTKLCCCCDFVYEHDNVGFHRRQCALAVTGEEGGGGFSSWEMLCHYFVGLQWSFCHGHLCICSICFFVFVFCLLWVSIDLLWQCVTFVFSGYLHFFVTIFLLFSLNSPF